MPQGAADSLARYRGIQYRIYPNEQQKTLCMKTFGCTRVVQHKILDIQFVRLDAKERLLTSYEANSYCTSVLKKEHPWMKEVDKFALTHAVFDACTSMSRFLGKVSAKPRYKSKRSSKQSYSTDFTNNNISVGKDFVKLPKLGKVKAVIHRKVPQNWVLKGATVTLNGDGTFIVSIRYKLPKQEIKQQEEMKSIGLDYSSSGLYVDSNGRCCNMPKYYKASAKRLAKEQRKLARKQHGKGKKPSKNYEKQCRKVAKIHRHVANQRKDYLHKTSTAIAKQYDVVCTEDLSVRKMMDDRKYRAYHRSTLDNGWYGFTVMLSYKLEYKGGKVVKVPKTYPSSQICCKCGHVNPELKDDRIRKWECPNCGAKHDRDENAAINIEREGLRMISA